MHFLKNPYSKFVLFLLTILILASQMVTGQTRYKKELNNFSDFDALKSTPLTNKYGNVEALKVVYDIKTNTLYYINSDLYQFHYNFCNEYLNTIYELNTFNEYNYRAAHKRKRYLLANINHYKSDDIYTLELSPIDEMTIRDIESLYLKIEASSYFEKFKFFLNTSRLEKLKHSLSIPTYTANDLYDKQTYQALGIYKNYGRLRFINSDSIRQLKITKQDILVIDKPILELPITAGLITTRLQTPLSHISILGQNRKVPMVAYTKAMTSEALKKFDNKLVSFEVKSDTFYIEEISNKVYKRKTKKRKSKMTFLKKNTTIDSLIDMNYLNKKSTNIVGGKAANFAVLLKLAKTNTFKVPESAFAIPFYFYERHVKKSRIDTLIKQLVSDSTSYKDADLLRKRLKHIRNEIKKTKLDSVLIASVEDKIKSLGSYRRMRFRSSTNAEDIVGFSGAGLYDSKTGIIGDSVKTVEKAIKKVWASLWNERAFLEREHFNINQNSVAMGVLVHRSFPNEKANGVAITKNLYRENYFGTVINVQLGEASVVNPEKNITCDQIICYAGTSSKLYNNKNIVEVISYSSLNNGQLVMSETEIIQLTKQLNIVKKHFYNRVFKKRKSYLDFALDIEFKIDGNSRDLYIKQARYFND